MYNEIKVGDTVGKPNFPHNLGIVKQIVPTGLVVEFPNIKGNNKVFGIKRQDVEKGIYGKMYIQDAEIVVDIIEEETGIGEDS